jgi:bifunctional DNA-binding transcriptional regulator/antitoxin component of YhaV-PrlF toxin-antitoxin module
MEKPAVDAEGKLTTPPHVLGKRGLRPGDELVLVEAAEGLLLYRHGVDTLGRPLVEQSQ